MLIAFGWFTIVKMNWAFSFANLIIPLLLIINGFSHIIQKKNDNKRWGFLIILEFALAIICMVSNLSLDTLGTLFGVYFLVENMALLIRSRYSLKEHVFIKSTLVIVSICGLLLSFCLLFSLFLTKQQILLLLGIYLIVSGIHNIVLSVYYVYLTDLTYQVKRKIRITFPVFINALFPRFLLKKLNSELATDTTLRKELNYSYTGDLPDLEVFIHVTEKSFGSIGHMDLCFEGTVISYGNYDSDSARLMEAVGDGVLITKAPRNEYLAFCIEHNQKTMFCFGLTLTDEQKRAVRRSITTILSDAYRWESHSQKNPAGTYTDYASCLTTAVPSELRKFTHGTFKRYFVLTTNCVLLADRILAPIGIDLLTVDGILAPGTYLNFLLNSYKREDSMVTSLAIYNDAKKVKPVAEK